MTLLEPGKYYHVFNKGINGSDIFRINENYNYFLHLYEKYIDPVAETFAWVLMKNHFHLLVRIKLSEEINMRQLPVPVKIETKDYVATLKKPHLYFSDLFNSYSQAFNRQERRTGALFQRPFKRIEVDNSAYFRNLVVYIHRNPEHHRFVEDYRDYPWSSYGTLISTSKTNIQREKVIGWFNGEGKFVIKHSQKDFSLPERYIIE